MKRLISMLLLSLALVAGAQVAQAAKPNKAAKPAKADRQAKKAAKGVAGTVIKVDGASIVLQTRGKKGGEVTIATDAKTKFMVGKKEGTLDDVKAGANIVASPANATAEKVVIRPTKAKKAPKAKAAKAAKNA